MLVVGRNNPFGEHLIILFLKQQRPGDLSTIYPRKMFLRLDFIYFNAIFARFVFHSRFN